MSYIRNANRGKAKGLAKLLFYTPPQMEVEGHWHNLPGSETLSISADGRWLVDTWNQSLGEYGVNDDKHHIRLWSYPELSLITEHLDVHRRTINTLTWSLDSHYLLTTAWIYDPEQLKKKEGRRYRQEIFKWRVQDWRLELKFDEGMGIAQSAYYLSDNRTVLIMTREGAMQLWDSMRGHMIEQLQIPETQYVFTLEQNPSNPGRVALGYEDEVWLYEIELPGY